jgi:Ribbon-helix-helix protein, copG family
VALTVRLSPKTERLLDAQAKRRGQTRSDVVREAIEQYGVSGEAVSREQPPYDHWADVIGVVQTAGRPPKQTTGELFTESVRRKARARRSR